MTDIRNVSSYNMWSVKNDLINDSSSPLTFKTELMYYRSLDRNRLAIEIDIPIGDFEF